MNRAEKIRAHRRARQVSQDGAAIEVKRSQTWLCRVERGAIMIDDEMFDRLITAIDRIAARNQAIEDAKNQAVARAVTEFENRKIQQDAGR